MSEQRNRILLGSLLLLVAGLWLFWSRDGAERVPGTPPTAGAGPQAPAPLTADAPATTPAAAPERVEAPEEPAPDRTQPATSLAHVRGRCVSAEDGAPLVGCRVKLGGSGRNQTDLALQGPVDWKDPEERSTGADGRFDIAFDPPSGFQFGLDVQADGRVPRTGRWGRIEKQAILDLGDIRLQRGFRVRGRVTDDTGIAVARVPVYLENLPLPLQPDMAANNRRYGFSSATGEFAIEVPIPAGRWPLGIDARQHSLVSPDLVIVEPTGAPEPVHVVVRSVPSIAGTVVDELGQPVQGVTIQVEKHVSGRFASARSRKDGTFEIFAVDATTAPAQLRISDPGPCEPDRKPAEPVAWGTRDLRIELRRALSFELTVVERGTGKPVEAYAVSCYHEDVRSSLQRDLRLGGTHPHGVTVVDRVWRGRNVLIVRPQDPALLANPPLVFEAGDAGVPPIRIELERLLEVTVLAVDASGAPVVDSTVDVIVKGSVPFQGDLMVSDPRRGTVVSGGGPGFRPHELCSTGTTGSDGRTQVAIPPGAPELMLRVTGKEHPKVLVHPAVLQPGVEFQVTIPLATSLRGMVTGAQVDARLLRVHAVPAASSSPDPAGRAEVGSDGSFAIPGLVPGTYSLRLLMAHRYQRGSGASTHDVPLEIAIPDFVVEVDKENRVEIDAGAFRPAALRGRVFVDGAVPSAARVVVMRDGGPRFGEFPVAPDGSFEATGLLAGKYRVGLVLGDFRTSEQDPIHHEDRLLLAHGDQVERNFTFTRRRLAIRILQPDGKPAANHPCTLVGGGFVRQHTTDADGRILLDPAPSEPFRLHVQDDQHQVRETFPEIKMPGDQTEHEVTLRMKQSESK